MNTIPIDSVRSPFRSVGRMAGLCDTMSCEDCDCPAIVAVALSKRVEKPEELRKWKELPEDIRELILRTRDDILASSSRRCEVCPITDHDMPVIFPKKLTLPANDDDL